MAFIFKKSENLRRDMLFQGDVLSRTAEVVDAIGQAHQYYANAPHYTHFVVITQSCDLVRRAGDFNAPYITISAAKPLRSVMNEYLAQKMRPIKGSDFKFLPVRELEKAKLLLERHLNNTEPDYFYLPKFDNENLTEDLLVFLRLSIALRKEHYDVLARAKIGELEDVFQAKIGWLKGNIYSRVGTPDLDEGGFDSAELRRRFFESHVDSFNAVQLSSIQADLLRERVRAKSTEAGQPLTAEEVNSLVESGFSQDVDIIAEKILDRLVKNGVVNGADVEAKSKALRSISNTPEFKALVSRA